MEHPPTIERIVIHVAEAPWYSVINQAADPYLPGSAHYVVRSSDGCVGQSVLEGDIAHHAGSWEYSKTTIGVTHEGYIAYPEHWFTDIMYRSSARLSSYLCKKYAIPVDREHVVGHDEVPPPETATPLGVEEYEDPGAYWDWDRYMHYIRHYLASPFL